MKLNCVKFSDKVQLYEYVVLDDNIEFYDTLFLSKQNIFNEQYVQTIKNHLSAIRMKLSKNDDNNYNLFDILYGRMMRLFRINLTFGYFLLNYQSTITPRMKLTSFPFEARKHAFLSRTSLHNKYCNFVIDVIHEFEHQYNLIKQLYLHGNQRINTFENNYVYGYLCD